VEGPLNIDEVRKGLEPSMFGRNIVFRPQMDSTHTLARRLARESAPEGTLVVTDEQRSGRGRMGRRWQSPPRTNLLFSLLLRPSLMADQVFVLTMTLALAAVDGIRSVCGVRSRIKWPNDLYAARGKLGGILTEFSATEKTVDSVVLGLGLNVNWNPRPEGLPYAATSLWNETGSKIPREALLCKILLNFDITMDAVLRGELEPVYHRWNRASMMLGKSVEVGTGGRIVSGTALRIDRDGSLIVKEADGGERRIYCGDVSLREGS
jgi:BirA family biotin operon repressor/biotin-[acetyl-CoA-carboxylase] ligase